MRPLCACCRSRGTERASTLAETRALRGPLNGIARCASNPRSMPRLSSERYNHVCVRRGRPGEALPSVFLRTPVCGVTQTSVHAAGDKITRPPHTKPDLPILQAFPAMRHATAAATAGTSRRRRRQRPAARADDCGLSIYLYCTTAVSLFWTLSLFTLYFLASAVIATAGVF